MPMGPAGRLLFSLLGTDAAWKVLEKALDTIAKTRPPAAPAERPPEAACAGHRALEAEVRRQADLVSKLGTAIEDMAGAVRPLVVRVTIALWLSAGALVIGIVALALALRR